MCGRFTLARSREEMAKFFATLPTPLQTWPRYNVAPSQTVPIVRPAASGRELVAMRWGIVPTWNRGSAPLLINARSETAATKPTFRKALQSRRCLIPATGFYEWRKEGRQKQPYPVPAGGRGPVRLRRPVGGRLRPRRQGSGSLRHPDNRGERAGAARARPDAGHPRPALLCRMARLEPDRLLCVCRLATGVPGRLDDVLPRLPTRQRRPPRGGRTSFNP